MRRPPDAFDLLPGADLGGGDRERAAHDTDAEHERRLKR